ncbi:hypothetical protein NE237_024635 [Protea cynaroides]|uniref:Uncharacterized protein n=1 Tax=Protea cynaroides TaxID=273540 RepID=A0A9Q0H1K4_9MAGN|nr:hypothetical protein NE237_024635 [Protea cynaroides]
MSSCIDEAGFPVGFKASTPCVIFDYVELQKDLPCKLQCVLTSIFIVLSGFGWYRLSSLIRVEALHFHSMKRVYAVLESVKIKKSINFLRIVVLIIFPCYGYG